MANGILFSTESLPVTPKYRHVSNDSNSENTPPELFTATVGGSCDLFCTEVIDERELQKPVLQPRKPSLSDNFNHPPVKANSDSILLKDDRVLQNLLRNEERYAPINPDYFKYIQVEVKPHMREEVTRWMLDVCEDNYLNELATNSTEVFCLAINFMDRFLAQSRIPKSTFQLLGATCLFLSSKFKAIEHISSKKLRAYTDDSITEQELKECELLILSRLRWELTATTPLDYLDHIIPRLALPPTINQTHLRNKTENIIAVAAINYYFCYKSPSLVAASAIFTALRSCIADKPKSMACLLSDEAARRQNNVHEKLLRDTKTCLQILTLAGGEELDNCCRYLAETLPEKLTGHQRLGPLPVSPDSTMALSVPTQVVEVNDGVTSTTSPTRPQHFPEHLTSTPARSRDPSEFCSAVDVFSDFNASVLQVVLNPNDSQIPSSSILCS